ncbi:excinuclease ABC subunit UvrB [Halobacteriovorax sp. GB3]|uniref:excinuclease ABC subunit UvrB n=1 Tax=Halobacteriovorax sp. GB3 TaxID=2719615 RepID=UPI0023603334|nr:excinuclease ABC subunit UvrB [Halobacteriovorax sp. GB3]MDD0853357.1 excinuclease ABC subunit UvrB [Halobacteriovorax sp. GB3]
MNTKSPFKLQSKFSPCGDQPEAIEKLLEGFEEGKKEQTLLGVTGSGKTFTMANVIEKMGKKTLILAHNKTLAAQLYAEFKEFFPENAVEYFVSYYDYYQPEAYVPGSDTYIEKDASVNDEIDKLRHSATRSLLERDDVIIIASVSCIYGIGSPDEYSAQRIPLFVGDTIERDDLLKKLVSIQYERNDMDFSRGCFRVRGDLVEVFPSHEDSDVIRIEFFDDEIETISIVDPLRGIVLKTLSKVTIYPKSHYVVGEEKLERAIDTIKVELRSRLQELESQGKLVEKQRLEQRTLLDLEMLEEMGFCSGIENYSRHLTGQEEGSAPPTLIDYFKDDFLLIIDESHITVSQVGGMYRGDRARKENLVNFGFRLPSALDNRPLNFKEFEKRKDHVLYVSATPADYELEQSNGEYVEQIIRPTGLLDPVIEVRDATDQVDDFLIESKKVIEKGFKVLVTTLTKKLAEELTNYYQSVGMRIRYLHSDIDTLERMEIIRDLRLGKFDILVGINLLREGLDIPEVALVGILDADKEGFLRSERSLIQTIGRAARNSEGKVFLYAYKNTKSMQKAISETSRRRSIQEKYNKDNGITPQTIIKSVSGGVIETLRGAKGQYKTKKNKVVEELQSIEEIDSKIESLSLEMKKFSRDLQFEKAAEIRDEIKKLKEARLLL